MNTTGFDLLISTDHVQSELARIAANPNLMGLVDLRLDGVRVPPRLILESIEVSIAFRTGRDRHPLACWGIVAIPNEAEQAKSEPSFWIEHCNPEPSQVFLILLLGQGAKRDQWKAWVVTGNQVQVVYHLEGLGHISFQTPRSATQLPSSISIQERWSRTIEALGSNVFARLQQTSVVLIGCSGVGTQIALQLAALPILRLGLVDGDQVESHNLARMSLATEADVGRNKAHVLAERILTMRGDLAISACDKACGYRAFEPISNHADLIITAVDRDLPRLAASHLSRRKFIPHLDVGTSITKNTESRTRLAADIRWLLPGAGCVSCVGGLRQREQAEYEMRAPAGALPRVSETWQANGRLGSLVTLNATAAATAIQIWLEQASSQAFRSTWHRIHWDRSTWVTEWSAVGADSQCENCKNSSTISSLV